MRGIVQVSHDAASGARHRRRMRQIDLDGGIHTTIAAGGEDPPPSAITVTASAPGLAPASVDIPLSTDPGADSVLAAAAESMPGGGAHQQQRW